MSINSASILMSLFEDNYEELVLQCQNINTLSIHSLNALRGIQKSVDELIITDIDANQYGTVENGNQIWMRQNLKTTHYNDGDEIKITVTPSKDCYIYVFNFMADQNAFLMYPNEFMKENFIKAKTILEIPDPAIRQHVSFVVSTLPGENMSAESAYIICTKEPVKLIEDLPMIGTSMPVLSNNSKSFMKLQRWLTRIPLNQRVEKNLIYHISN